MSKSVSKNVDLDAVLIYLKAITDAVDLRWLLEALHAWRDDKYLPKLHGFQGGHEFYPLSEALEVIAGQLPTMSTDDLATLEIMVGILYDLLSPQTGDSSRGAVQLKTLIKKYPEIDFETGLPQLDQDGNPIMVAFPYTYAYIRLHASKGDKSRQRSKLLSIYADRGMGKGGSGGVVAAALESELITDDQILDAWHAGKEAYQKFIDECVALVPAPAEPALDRLGSLENVPNLSKQTESDPTLVHQQPLIDTMQPLNDALAAAWFDDWHGLPTVIERLGKLYFERHGYDWTLTGATIRIEGRACYLDIKRGSPIYFQNKEKAQRFLAGYVASGKPNFAMVRQL